MPVGLLMIMFFMIQMFASVQDIQNFINDHTPACDTWGTGRSEYGGTRAQYAVNRGWHGPAVCLFIISRESKH